MESFGFLSDNGQGFLNDIGIDPMESMEFLQPPYTKNESQFDLPFGGKNNEQQNHRYQAASKNMPVYIQSESSRTLQNHIQETIPPNRHSQSHQQQETEPMAIEYSPRIRQLPMRPPLPPAEFETPHQTQLQMAPSRVRVNSEMDLPIEEIGTVPIDQIDRESHVILPDGKQIVLLQLLEDGSYAQIRGDNVSKNVVFSQTKENPTLRISNADDYQPAPSIPTSEYDSRQVYDENQKTEINGSMSQDNGINIKHYHPTNQEDEQSAERRRRSSMKQGFDHLETLLNETMANTPGHTVPTKISKAGLLMKAKDTIIRHQMEKKRKQQEIDLLRRECENLQQQISCAQEQLPETGYPLSKVRSDKNQREFLAYVASRTEQNYKFFPFYLIMKRMFESYNQVVAVQDATKFRRTSQEWLQHSCSLPHVRPAVSDATRYISTDTCIFRPNADFPADCVRKVHGFLKESSKY